MIINFFLHKLFLIVENFNPLVHWYCTSAYTDLLFSRSGYFGAGGEELALFGKFRHLLNMWVLFSRNGLLVLIDLLGKKGSYVLIKTGTLSFKQELCAANGYSVLQMIFVYLYIGVLLRIVMTTRCPEAWKPEETELSQAPSASVFLFSCPEQL